MPNTSQDRAKIASRQDPAVRYEAAKTGASKDEVRKAVKSEGNCRDAIEHRLGYK